MAVKKSGKSGSKKITVKKNVKTNVKTTGKSSSKRSPLKNTEKKTTGKNATKQRKINIDKTPVYVLSIMVLFTVIILLINHNINKSERNNFPHSGNNNFTMRNDSGNLRFQNSRNDVSNKANKQKIIDEEVKEKQSPVNTDAKQELYIYLIKFDRKSESMSLAPVKRILKTRTPLTDSLKELIKGPSSGEKRRGLLTAVPADLNIRDVRVEGRNVVLDFNSSIEENADGQILLTRIDQLVYTATQFDGIDGVIIKVNGRRKEFLGGEGLSVSKPIGRRNDN